MGELLLSVDTATPAGSVAVSRGPELLGEVLLNVRANHTDRLLEIIRLLLANLDLTLSQLDGFGVVLGPGSFTGLRVGVATVKGLALATGKPVVGVSSLATLAQQTPCSAFPVCALLDARKAEVYAALYHRQNNRLVPLGPEAVLPPEKLLDSLSGEVLFIGNGASVYRELITARLGERAHFAPWPQHLPRAANAAVLALENFRDGRTIPLESLVPTYIRPSEAELLWTARAPESCAPVR